MIITISATRNIFLNESYEIYVQSSNNFEPAMKISEYLRFRTTAMKEKDLNRKSFIFMLVLQCYKINLN